MPNPKSPSSSAPKFPARRSRSSWPSAQNCTAKFATWRSAITRIRAERPTWGCCPTGSLVTRTPTIRRRAKRSNGSGAAFIPSKPGLTAPAMVEAAQNGKLKALYVMGANPLSHFGTLGFGRGKLELLIVHEMFLTETAKLADIVFPAASAYEKEGTRHQHFRRNSASAQSRRSDGSRAPTSICCAFCRINWKDWDSARRSTTKRLRTCSKKFAKRCLAMTCRPRDC